MIKVRQSQKPHDANRLHDHLLAQGLRPSLVESDDDETRIYFADAGAEEAAQAAVTSYQHQERQPAPSRKELLEKVRAKLQEAKTKKSSTIPDWRNSVDETLGAIEGLLAALIAE